VLLIDSVPLDDEPRSPVDEVEPPRREDLDRPWELRLRDALVEAAGRREARRSCTRP
jgi:hypothetical protein